jgi:uncharacterized delta-60 repeat protein
MVPVAAALLLTLSAWRAGLVMAATGVLDPTFGAGGVVRTSFGGSARLSELIAQPDGKLIAAGARRVTTISDPVGAEAILASDFALARYNVDGSLDTTFGVDGRVTTEWSGFHAAATALALQPDGKVLAGGIVDSREDIGPLHGVQTASDLALARYGPDGTLDPTFGDGGQVTADFGRLEGLTTLALQPDGKIIAAGVAEQTVVRGQMPTRAFEFLLARFQPDGGLDPSFGSAGQVVVGFNPPATATTGPVYARAGAVVVQPDGRIVAAGSTTGTRWDFALARLWPDGSLDTSFGAGGTVTTAFPELAVSGGLALQPDGRLVLAGTSGRNNIALARYAPDGSLDLAFGKSGRVVADFGGVETAMALAVQADGKLVVAGGAGGGPLGLLPEDFGVARFLPDGTPDAEFGNGSQGTLDLGGRESASAVAIQPDGGIVVAGDIEAGLTNRDFALVRYQLH